jgi:putative adenylate-forming enzyme
MKRDRIFQGDFHILETDSFFYFFLACKHRFKYMNTGKLHKYQEYKSKAIVDYAVNHSSFFSSHYHGFDLKQVSNLPTVNKSLMMEHLSDYNTVGFKKEEMIDFCDKIEKSKQYNSRFQGYNIAMSSGTSGNKSIVITSPYEEKYLQAAFFARFPFPLTMRIKWAFILRITTPAFNVKKFGQQLHYISLLKPRKEFIDELQELNPNIISAPPSMLKIIANEVLKGTLSIEPKRIISYAEVLSSDVKHEIEKVFGIPVFQIYQSSEGPIGMPCKHGNLHINEDLMYVQTLNQDDTPTEVGKPCHKLLVTDLNKRSQPIIRFELNDMITISPNECECGSSFRVITQIHGRADDLFLGKNEITGGEEFIFPDYIRRAIIQSSEEINEYQAIQKSHTEILVRVITMSGEQENLIVEKITQNIQNVFKSYHCELPSIHILFEKPLKNPRSQKLIRIHREF